MTSAVGKPIIVMLLFSMALLSPVVSFSGTEKGSEDKILEYLDKIEEFILDLTPDGHGREIEKLFEKLREILKGELGTGEESGTVQETWWKDGIKENCYGCFQKV